MYKLLIITKNLSNTKTLINSTIGKILDMQVIGIATNKEDFQYFQNLNNFDFILFHNCNYISDEITDNISGTIYIGPYKTSVKKFEDKIEISNNNSTEVIIKEIENFTAKVTLNTIRQEAMEILLDLGFSFKHIGSKYLADAIYYCYTNVEHDCCFENFEKEIYPYIAKVNNTQVANVKWSLTRTINLMYMNHTTKSVLKLEKYFYLDRFEKPTPKMVIGTITNNLIGKYREDL